jgi:hypothetical protein
MGMHRSGTGLVANLLESLGLFIGAFKDSNHESFFFITINDWFLRISGGAWDNPDAIDRLLSNVDARRIILNHTRKTLKSFHRIRYSGFKYYQTSIENLGYKIPWGWKDPRNTITLPIWLDLYPNAKIIHISRHGIDVANSLLKRQKVWYQRALFPSRYRRARYFLRPFGGIYLRSVGFQTLDEGLKLWSVYMEKASASMRKCENNFIEIRYEDLIIDPKNSIIKLQDFCNLKNSSSKISNTLKKIDQTKAFAYRNNPELKSFAKANSNTLSKYGYSI